MTHDLKKNPESKKLQKLFHEEWEFTLKENPLFATHTGDRRYNDRLGSAKQEDIDKRAGQKAIYLQQLKKINRSRLDSEDKINYDIFKRLLENSIAEHGFKSYLMPVSKTGGFFSHFPEMHDHVPLRTVKDYENYISRLNEFKEFVGQHIELMKTGIRKGYVPPSVVMEGIENSIKPHIVKKPAESLLFKPFNNIPASFSIREKSRIIKNGTTVITKSVIPSFSTLLDFIMREYIPATRETISASSLPNGRDYYRHRVKLFTSPEYEPEKIHKTGLDEVRRIRSEMLKAMKKTDFSGDFPSFLNFLRRDKRFYAKSADDLMKEAASILKKMDGELPKLFETLPRLPYGIREVPEYIAPRTTTAYYSPGTGDGTRAGFYYINTSNLNSRPLYEMEALSLHEAVPGHHLQIALQQELHNLPAFRRFGGFTAFVEGWALYSERLGLEVGFYKDAYSDFGRLIYEAWRASRLVIDTGVHWLGWSRDKAIDFMASNTGLTILNIKNEVDRYIAWPGQALAYKIGELKIRELRNKAEKNLRQRFDIRKFHDVVLRNGAVPLDVLESNVNDWIKDWRKKKV